MVRRDVKGIANFAERVANVRAPDYIDEIDVIGGSRQLKGQLAMKVTLNETAGAD